VITTLDNAGLNAPDGFPELPGGIFRVTTIAAVCAGNDDTVVVAWADYRERCIARLLSSFTGWRRHLGGFFLRGPAAYWKRSVRFEAA
jgi:hypothetical protein